MANAPLRTVQRSPRHHQLIGVAEEILAGTFDGYFQIDYQVLELNDFYVAEVVLRAFIWHPRCGTLLHTVTVRSTTCPASPAGFVICGAVGRASAPVPLEGPRHHPGRTDDAQQSRGIPEADPCRRVV